MQCENCGFDECLEGDRFCIKCGARLARDRRVMADVCATRRVYDLATVYMKLARTYHLRGRFGEARRACEKVLEAEPDHAEASEMLQRITQTAKEG